jgi:hypothetical protein
VEGQRALAVAFVALLLSSSVACDDGRTPGRPVRDAESRVIAEAAGVRLFAWRQETEHGRFLSFSFGSAARISGRVEDWRARLDSRSVAVLGAGLFGPGDALDSFGRFPLLGVTARSVSRVELRYVSGPPLVRDGVRGGFVLLADAGRRLRELVVYDAEGRRLGRTDVSHLDMRYLCEQEPVCPSP